MHGHLHFDLVKSSCNITLYEVILVSHIVMASYCSICVCSGLSTHVGECQRLQNNSIEKAEVHLVHPHHEQDHHGSNPNLEAKNQRQGIQKVKTQHQCGQKLGAMKALSVIVK